MLKERNDNIGRGNKKDKVVRRELCSVLTKGTRTHSHLDEGPTQGEVPAPSSVLMCLIENTLEDRTAEATSAFTVFGVCLVDTVLSTVTFSQFDDNKQLSRLRTLITQFCPTEVLLEQDGYSPLTRSAIAVLAPQASVECLLVGEISNADNVLVDLEKAQYWTRTPEILQSILDGYGTKSSDLLLRALDGVIFQLKRCRIDYEIFSAGKISTYTPFDNDGLSVYHTDSESRRKHLVLDDVALANLEILQNSSDKSDRGSLWSLINRCKTPFGSRLLREWLCKPLISLEEISARRDAIIDLQRLETEADKARSILKRLPDVERLLNRVHCNGLLHRSTSHPDARAIMFEPALYNSRKIRDFADVLGGFEGFLEVLKIFEDSQINAPLLIRLTKAAPFGNFPSKELSTLLVYFR